IRDEAAVSGAIAATAVVLRTPRPVDFARRRTNIERGERGQDQQEQYGADCLHGEPPGSGAPSMRISGLFGGERNREPGLDAAHDRIRHGPRRGPVRRARRGPPRTLIPTHAYGILSVALSLQSAKV